MKVRMLTTYAGPKGNFKPGDVVDVENDEAKALIEGRHAEHAAEEEARGKRNEKAAKKAAAKKKAQKLEAAKEAKEAKEKANLNGAPETADDKAKK